ncbi:hypothetical protein [uncultured Flavobacterium sp.]|uniref:hypothetical protein n=1 Tax=uncultured Flavobacterium sp. TaxID=165435 RepID=UPI0030ECFEA8|tara:strand:+ start:53572 stop:55686 length:2115 start_codon:yes stop_codon:yes gene_type:complete
MKKILTFLFLGLFFIANAQDKNKVKEFFWGANDTYKKVTTIPEKYKNESAVEIIKFEDYDYHKFGKSVTFTSSYRKRIKLLDQAAVTEFSEFSFEKDGAVGIKIIKPSGKEVEIDIEKEAKIVDNYKKIAVSGLEIGDIIDFYSQYVSNSYSIEAFGFEPVESTLGSTYPIMNYKLIFQTENDFFVNFNTYNGAPQLKEIPTKKGNERRYELEAQDIPKNDFPRWFLPLVELPCYKFQVFFARSGKFEERAEAFLPEKESIVKSVVSKEDIFNFYNTKFSPSGDIDVINDFLKGKTFDSQEDKVKAVYYFTRHQFYTRYVEAFVIDEAKIMYPFDLYGYNPTFFTKEQPFINYFMQFLKKNRIDYDIIVSTGRENGPIKDILIQSNTKILLKIYTENPIYFGLFTPYSSPEMFAYEIENTNAYALKVSKNRKVDDIESIKLPESTYKDNISKVTTNITLASDFNTINVAKTSSLYGHNKEFEQESKILFYDYVNEDYEKYGTKPLLDMVSNKKKKEQYKKEYEALIKKIKDNKNEKFKTEAEQEYGVKLDKHELVIKNTGRFGKNDPLTYDEKFVITNSLIKKAGPNYILEIGKFISSQVDIEDKESKRTNNIYSIFPRSYEYTINLDIPEGYTVAGLEKINVSVENVTGSFKTVAEIKNNKLSIVTSKCYYHSYEPNANWSKMIEFLDASYQFSQEKILLKKN